MSGTASKKRLTSPLGSAERETTIQHNALITDVERLRGLLEATTRDQVITTGTTAGLSVDANAQDIETDNAIVVQHKGVRYAQAAVAAFDISVSGTCAGDIINQNTHGVFWVFINTAGALDTETPLTPQLYTSQIAAYASYAFATNTLPPGTDDVAIGVVHVQENNSGAFTIGTDSITAETETYVDFHGVPAIETAAASLALDAGAATFTYGAGAVRLGSGVRVAYTGKVNVTIAGSTVANGAYGAWLIYVLADDSEIAVQLGAAYTTLALAQAAVRDHNRNPYLPMIGAIYVYNNSGAVFTPGTTFLDATGISTTFAISAALGQTSAAAGTLTAAQVQDIAGTVIAT